MEAHADTGRSNDASPHPFAGRYELGQILKRSNGVETFLARDRVTGAQVVLKSIAPRLIHDAARLRFEHETHVLRQLVGTGLPGLLDAGIAEDRWFLVQPFLPGLTLENILTSGPLPLEAALRVAIDIVTALDVAHSAGVFHRDVKPANVIVDGIDPVNSVTLIDFGFARSSMLDEAVRDDMVGTVRYLAPEAAGLLSVPIDERSDLYAVGVLLFECLTGRPPFPGPTVGEMLRQHMSMPVPDVRDSRAGTPRALDAILQRLLSKGPVDRYQSAAAVALDLNAVLAAIEEGEPDRRIVIGRFDHRRTLTDPAFVGREAELITLQSLLRAIEAGESGLVLLEADSGGGKSRLLDEIAAQADDGSLTLLRGQGVLEAGQRPFTILQGVAADLVSSLSTDVALLRSLRDSVGDSASAIARALPALGPLLGVEEFVDNGPEQFGERRSLAALRHLIHSVAGARRPVLIILDDCQWADRLTVRLLTELFSGESPLPEYVGIVAAFRSEEVAADDPLRAIARSESVVLGPLSPAAMAQLVESMAGPVPEIVINIVVRLAEGSPFMGAAVLRGLSESQAIVGSDRGWQVDRAAIRDVQTARRSAGFLVRRLELLSAGSLRVLSAGAALGKEFDFVLAAELAGHSDSAAAILEESRRRRLVYVDELSGRCSFFHDKIREALLDRLSGETLSELHSEIADVLLDQQVGDTAAFELAYHLDAAGRHDAALPHALRSAEIARTQHGLDSAVAHYRMAERGVAEDDLATQVIIAEGLGEVLTLEGAYREAKDQFMAAQELVDDRVHQASLDGKLGDLAFKQGDVVTAQVHLEGAMARLGRPVPTNPIWLLVRLFWEVLVQAAHTAVPRLTTGRRDPTGHEEDFLAMRLHSRLAYLYWFHSGKITCAWSHLRGVNLAERYPTSDELGQAYSEHAPVMTMIPLFTRALKYAHQSLDIRRDRGDTWGQGQSLGFAGVTLYAASRFDEGEEACREAIRLLESTGDQWEVNTAGWNLAMCLYRKGELVESATVARDVYESAMAIGDQIAAGVGLSVWTRATGGAVSRRLISDELSRGSKDASTTTELRLAAGIQALHDDDIDDAFNQLNEAAETIRKAGLRQEYIAPVACWRATVARLRAEQAQAHDPATRARLIRQASRASRSARLWAFSYRNNAPHALREAGLVASLRGRERTMKKLMRQSLTVANAQGARYEAALTECAIARLACSRGGPEGAYDNARAVVREFEGLRLPELPSSIAPSVSLFDRFTTLLSVGRTIAAAPSLEAVELAIREAAISLLRGDRCHLVSAKALLRDDATTTSGESVDHVSRTLLAHAAATGMPAVAGDALASESESLLLSGLRSVLAAPIIVHGEPTHFFYVTHRHLDQLFGEEEIQLAAFISTLAGAAYEHLAGIESRFSSLAQTSSNVLTLVDSEGIVSYQSSAASRVFDLPEPGLIGRPIGDWVHPEDLPEFSAALRRSAGEEEVIVECRFRKADGSYLPVETAITNLVDDPTVNSLVLNSRDVTERRRLEDELRERALYDSLTGLPNRSLFIERAERAHGRRAPQPLVVCFLDLDDFKAVNDTHGHRAGDELLRVMGQRLSDCLRPEDTVARLGGDEFAILLQNTDLSEALVVVDRILEATGQPITVADTELQTQFSVGIATSDGVASTPDELLAEADIAMYAAKSHDRHRYRVFEPAMRVAAESRSRIRSAIELALEEQEFRLHYQPIIDIRTGDFVGAEALVRWQHSERGLLAPADFIAIAESTGQITAIGEWVLRQACSAAGALPAASLISVNISARQLQEARLVDTVSAALEASGLAPQRLVLEITETTSVANMKGAITRLSQLKSLGVKLALDDFGTGFSTLNYLRRFPVDYLKIDRTFVRDITENADDRAIVRGVIELAHSLGLQAIAEGVETAGQRDVVTSLGCDLGQGFLWMKPVPVDELPGWSYPAPPTAA